MLSEMCHSTAYIRLFAKLALSLPVNEVERLLHITARVKVDSSDSRAVANAKSKEVQNQCYVRLQEVWRGYQRVGPGTPITRRHNMTVHR